MTELRAGGATDTGLVRDHNEDSFLADEGLFVVADGVGGHKAGEVASQTAVETIKREFREPTTDGLVDAVKTANRTVWNLAEANPDQRGMGTTLTALALVDEDGEERLAVVNVGDSRAYLLQHGELEQLTEDHSLVEQLVREGQLTPEEAQVHPQRSIITRALGLDPDVEVDSWELTPYKGDRILLCSDGLTNEVSDDEIASTLRTVSDPDEAAHQLVHAARDHGGSDNITCVVVDVVDDNDRAEVASSALAGEPPPPPRAVREAAVSRTDDDSSAARATAPPPAPRPAAPQPAVAAARPRRFTWRVVVFVVAVVVVIAAALAAVGWYARHTYFVGLDHGQVAIFKGRPGGLLWFNPTLDRRTSMTQGDVPAARLPDVKAGHEESTRAEAQRYVNALRQEAAAQTTTTAPPASPAPSTPAPPPSAP
ncbi:MAG TPA: Stp1/IreP family PP2C-type Ser/Thr phosphatase [Acidimicrobiales bacterium]|nr:Stp1/IreP family PP2C-type Ser/Thr phosphatase [Acidimicrobiales bacterium]